MLRKNRCCGYERGWIGSGIRKRFGKNKRRLTMSSLYVFGMEWKNCFMKSDISGNKGGVSV